MHIARTSLDDRSSRGITDPGFNAVRELLDEQLTADPRFSAQLSVIWRGRTVIDLVGGDGLANNSITGVYSASKGVAAAVIGMLLDEGDLDLDARVSRYWPEFASAGKGQVTVRQALAHQAGVIGVEAGFSLAELVDSAAAAAKLAASPPLWQPGSTHGYHALTIGVIMEELVRRVTGSTLQQRYEQLIRAPRGIDFYLGLAESEEPRYRAVVPAFSDGAPAPTPSTDGIQSVAFNTLHATVGPTANDLGPNNPLIRAAGIAAIGGVGSARGLAGLYAAVLGNGTDDPLLSESTIEQMSRLQSFGLDRVLGFQTAFGIGFMKPHPLMDFGSYAAFGHDGAGGALAFADPLHEVAFGYIPSPMQLPGGADPKAVLLSQVVRASIRAMA